MTTPAYRKARRTFWILTTVAVLLIGALSAVLRAPAGPGIGVAVATVGVLAAITIALASRLLLALTGRLGQTSGHLHLHGRRVTGARR